MTITLKDFFQFLIDNKVLHPFMKYLKTNHKWRRNFYITENASSYLTSYIANNEMVHQIILHAFAWDKTYEGHAFWEKISNSWRAQISNIELANMYRLVQQDRKKKYV